MSVAAKLGLRIAVLVALVVATGGAAVGGLLWLSGQWRAAGREGQLLRTLYEVGSDAATAQLLARRGERRDAQNHLDAAMRRLRPMLAGGGGQPTLEPRDHEALAAVYVDLRGVRNWTRHSDPLPPHHAAVGRSLGRIAQLTQAVNTRIGERERAGRRRAAWLAAGVTGLTLLAAAAAVAVGVRQYRGVMRPLRALERAAGDLAAGRFDRRVGPMAGREHRRVAEAFDRMAGELADLYADLERRVRVQSRQLVEAERLAGLGRLAAGLAHEINNPLAVILGHAEAALRRLPSPGPGPDRDRDRDAVDEDDRLRRALEAVRDEALRAHAITTQLLQLARGEGSAGAGGVGGAGEPPVRERVDVAALARRVAGLVEALPQAQGRALRVGASPGAWVLADEGELTQVLLNLLLNALEAVDVDVPERKVVRVRVEREMGRVTLTVTDAGRGMDESTRRRVFEPFFTASPAGGRRRPGAGLGLSVTHAIVTSHGGRIDASSDGPGLGSRFRVELPAA